MKIDYSISIQCLDGNLEDIIFPTSFTDELKSNIKNVLHQMKSGNTFDVTTSLPKELKKYGSCGIFGNVVGILNYQTREIEITFMEDEK